MAISAHERLSLALRYIEGEFFGYFADHKNVTITKAMWIEAYEVIDGWDEKRQRGEFFHTDARIRKMAAQIQGS